MKTNNFSTTHPSALDMPQPADAGRQSFSSPIDGARQGRLEIRGGWANAALAGDPGLKGLFQADFLGLVPHVEVRGGEIRARYRLDLFTWLKYALLRAPQEAEVRLNTSLPWSIQIKGGVSGLRADLSALDLHGLHITGGASQVSLTLPQPQSTVTLLFSGGASRLEIYRPSGVEVCLEIRSGSNRVRFDGQETGAVGRPLRLETPGFRSAARRYEIQIGGGASRVKVEKL